jgi:hypothetical protein
MRISVGGPARRYYKALAEAQRAEAQASGAHADVGGVSDASAIGGSLDISDDAEAAASAIAADTGGSDDSPDISSTDAS